MKQLFKILKKDPVLTISGLLAVIFVLWFSLAPREFKTFWSRDPLVAEIIKEHNQVEQKSKLASISVYYPFFPYFAGIVVGIEHPRKEWMDTYYLGRPYIFSLYYGKVAEMYPDNDAGHYLLGYCEYYSGDIDMAREQFEKTIKLDPSFFWSYYNLGVIYFQQGNFFKSADILSKAFTFKKEITLNVLRQETFYGQIWSYIADPPQILGKDLDEGQEDAAFLLAAYLVKAGRFDQALQIIRPIGQGTAWHRELWGDLYEKAVNKQSTTNDIDRLIKEQIPVRLF
jgi:tetratricopeptide (TPR) repeat protein